MPQKETPRQITVAEMAPHVHSFGIGENKVNKISNWLIRWIKNSLKSGKIKPLDFLPLKGDLACHIGVSKGTIQNVYRSVEDYGLIESKQRVGTYIKKAETQVDKLTSRREAACEAIKEYLFLSGYNNGDTLIPIRRLAILTGISPTTIKTAINTLILQGILIQKDSIFVVNNMNFKINEIETKTLVEKIAERIKSNIIENLSSGEKLPSNSLLAKKFNVSVKTVHDAIKVLHEAGLLNVRRGCYGTVISSENNQPYYYEETEAKIKHYISTNCKEGDKLPSIRDMAKYLQVSSKTIKRALDNLAEDGFVASSRGRYGGTFVLDIPPNAEQAYTWLALNPDFMDTQKN